MSLNSAPPAHRSVPIALVAVIAVIAAGASVAVTAAYFELRPLGSGAGPVTVTDDVGRTVAVPSNPERVVVLSPSILDPMVRLGLRSHVVGVDCYAASFGGLTADYTPDQIAQWNLSSNLCVQTGPTLDTAAILNRTPALVLASTIESIADVEELSVTDHLPVLVLQPTSLAGVLVDVNALGRIFNVGPASDALVAQLQTELGTIASGVANLTFSGSPLPTVLVTYYASPAGGQTPGYWTYGPATFGQSLIEAVGGVNIASTAQIPYPELSGPQVLAADPWAIFYGTGFGLDLTGYLQGPDWSSFSAVGSGRAFAIDSTLLTEADPTMILVGLPTLYAELHPAA